jgi:hypothetical protein
MTLLLVRLPGDNGHDVLWPWEQDEGLRQAALMHTVSCRLCEWRAHAVFGTDVPKITFTPSCTAGAELAHDLRAHAAAKRAPK